MVLVWHTFSHGINKQYNNTKNLMTSPKEGHTLNKRPMNDYWFKMQFINRQHLLIIELQFENNWNMFDAHLKYQVLSFLKSDASITNTKCLLWSTFVHRALSVVRKQFIYIWLLLWNHLSDFDETWSQWLLVVGIRIYT